MGMMSTIIVDDEPLAVELLINILNQINDIEVICQCNNGREAVQKIAETRPDLIFLDIEMPKMTGFDVIKALSKKSIPMIIFVTAFDRYAVNAFDVDAVDYVLKPLDPNRITLAVERARSRWLKNNLENSAIDEDDCKRKDDVPERFEPTDREKNQARTLILRDKLVIKDAGVVNVVAVSDIDWIDAAGDYMCVHALGRTYILRSTMKQLMEKLDRNLFVRVHRSTVVNITRVVTIRAHQKGGSTLVLENGESLRVSRNYRQYVSNLFSHR
ncbi:MAG: DNA-binding response regulator [Porticoccaceae bacterium]|nr:DNA-binding response regulator [Porticoccaceae bacterium]